MLFKDAPKWLKKQLSNIKNSFQIKDENIKQESFLDNKTNRIIITALLIGVIGAIISLLIPKKHK